MIPSEGNLAEASANARIPGTADGLAGFPVLRSGPRSAESTRDHVQVDREAWFAACDAGVHALEADEMKCPVMEFSLKVRRAALEAELPQLGRNLVH